MRENSAVLEFIAIIDVTHGLYLDARRAFGALLRELQSTQAENLKRLPGKTVQDLDNLGFAYEAADPEPGSPFLHACTQGEYKARNSPTGRNPTQVGNMCVAHIFNFWEDHYRARIAESLGMQVDDLKIPVFGDLRHLRNSIVHHRAIALAEVERCTILKWFKEGQTIALDREQFRFLVQECVKALRALTLPLGTQATSA